MEGNQNQSLETAISYCIENFSAMEATKRIIDYIKSDRELTKKLCQYDVSNRSEQLVSFLKWVGDGCDFENNAESIVKEYIDEGN